MVALFNYSRRHLMNLSGANKLGDTPARVMSQLIRGHTQYHACFVSQLLYSYKSEGVQIRRECEVAGRAWLVWSKRKVCRIQFLFNVTKPHLLKQFNELGTERYQRECVCQFLVLFSYIVLDLCVFFPVRYSSIDF